MKIIKLEAQNVKRLKAVTIEPNGNMIVIGGENGNGKSSTLDAILYGMGGKSAICKEPLRRGEKKGQTVITTDTLVIKRTFTEGGGGTLTVENKEGASYKSPQAILDALVGEIAFDPLSFANEEGKQLERLKRLVGLDFSKQDAERKALYDERTAVNREYKAALARFNAAPKQDVPPDTQPEKVDVAALMREFDSAQAVNAASAKKRNDLEDIRTATKDLDADIRDIKKRIEDLQAELYEMERTRAGLVNEGADLEAVVDALVDTDTQPIKDRIASAQAINDSIRDRAEARSTAIRANAEKDRLKVESDAKQAESEAITARIDAVDRQKAEALAGAKFPIPGLSFDDTGVIYNGLPLEQASDAEKLRVSVAIGLAMNPELKVLLIRNGSLLDENSLRMVAEMAEAADAQVWMERVGHGKECSVIIEDGMVKAYEKYGDMMENDE